MPAEAAIRSKPVTTTCPVCRYEVDAWHIRTPACRWPKGVSRAKPYVLVTYWYCRSHEGHCGKVASPYAG